MVREIVIAIPALALSRTTHPTAFSKMTTLIVDFPSRRRHITPPDVPASASASALVVEQAEQEPKQQRRVSFANVSQMKVVVDIATEDAVPDLYYT